MMKKKEFRGKLGALGGENMGLKFQRDDSLDKKFEEFALLPEDKDKDKKEKEDALKRFLEPKEKKDVSKNE